MSLAVKVAKRQAGIPDDKRVKVVEVIPPLNAPLATLLAGGNTARLESVRRSLAGMEGDGQFTLLAEIVLLLGLQVGPDGG